MSYLTEFWWQVYENAETILSVLLGILAISYLISKVDMGADGDD